MRERVTLAERMREIHAKRDFDPLDRIEEEKAELLVEEVEIDGVAELGTGLELLGADGARRVGGIGDELLERLPIGGQAPVADPLEMEDRLGLIRHHQPARHQKGELVGKTEMGFGIGRKHPAQI